jgi:hypothetical protein
MKTKIILSSLLIASTQLSYAIPNNQSNSILRYQMTSSKTIEVNKALVSLNLYLTILKQSPDTKVSALKEINSILPSIKWKITNYKEDQTKSGAIDVTISMQNRLTKSEIEQFRKNLNKYSNNDDSIKIENISYSPSEFEIQNTKQDLMLSIIKQTKNYAKKLNQELNSNYNIKEIDFSSNNYQPPTYNSNRMVMLAGVQKDKDINVSKKYTMNANIILENDKSSQKNDITKSKIGGNKVLPPSYLGIHGFKNCLSTKNMGSWQSYCIPNAKPQNCEQNSWESLKKEKLPICN